MYVLGNIANKDVYLADNETGYLTDFSYSVYMPEDTQDFKDMEHASGCYYEIVDQYGDGVYGQHEEPHKMEVLLHWADDALTGTDITNDDGGTYGFVGTIYENTEEPYVTVVMPCTPKQGYELEEYHNVEEEIYQILLTEFKRLRREV